MVVDTRPGSWDGAGAASRSAGLLLVLASKKQTVNISFPKFYLRFSPLHGRQKTDIIFSRIVFPVKYYVNSYSLW